MAPYPNCNIKRIYFFNTNLNYNNIFSRDLYYVASSANSTNEFIINALPETQFGDISKLDEDKKNCIICLEDYKIGDKAISKTGFKLQNSFPFCKFELTPHNLGLMKI
jgi:hypothetical protein